MIRTFARDDRAGRAHALDFAGFEKPQQRPLHPRAHLADFVQKHGAIGRRLENARLVAIGVGEAAARMPEQLRFDEGVGQPRAVDRGQWGDAAGASLVNQTGDQVLADAGLPGDEHSRIGTRGEVDLIVQRACCVGVADQPQFGSILELKRHQRLHQAICMLSTLGVAHRASEPVAIRATVLSL